MFSRSPRRFFSLILLVLFIALGLSSLVAAGGLLFALLAIDLPLGFRHYDTTIILPAAILFIVSLQLFTYSSLKAGETRQLAWFKVTQSSVTGAVQSAGGLVGGKWIIFGYVAGLFLCVPLLIRTLSGLSKFQWRRMRWAVQASAIRYRRYPAYVCPNELIDVASHQIPMLLIGMLFSVATLGQYGFAQRILAAPAAIVGQAVSQVFFKSISDQATTSSAVRRLMIRVWVTMGLIGLLPFSLLLVAGESIFVWVFGSSWGEAGRMAEVLSLLLFCRFVSSPTSTIYYKLNLQKEQLGYCILGFAVRIAPVFLTFNGYSILDVLALQVAGEIIVILAFNVTALLKLRNAESEA